MWSELTSQTESWLAKVFGRNPYLFRVAEVASVLESWIGSMTVCQSVAHRCQERYEEKSPGRVVNEQSSKEDVRNQTPPNRSGRQQ